MDILVIAPAHEDLPNAAEEIVQIARNHNATIVRGTVRETDIIRAVDDADYEVIWWISHGNSDGVLLSDGVLSIVGVAQFVQASGAKLCVLNTCESEAAAQEIVLRGQADVICTIAPVGNADAIRLGSLLAAELAADQNYREAYEIVVGSSPGLYRYLQAGQQTRQRISHDNNAILQEIYRVLVGNEKFGEVGLVKRVGNLEVEVTHVKVRVEKVETRMGDIKTELIEIGQLIRSHSVGTDRITLTRTQLALALLGLVVIAGALAFALWMSIRGGGLDGSVGFTIRFIFVFSDVFLTGL